MLLDGDDRSSLHGDEGVGERGGEVALMGGEDDGAALGAEAGQEREHLAGAGCVHIGEGFVEEQQIRLWQQDSCQGRALTHALGILADGARQGWVEAGGAHGFSGCEAGAGAVEAREIAEIFDAVELVVKHGRMAHVADAVALVGRAFAEDGHGAESGAEESGDGAE